MSAREEFWREVSEITNLHARVEFIRELEREFARARIEVQARLLEQEREELEQEWKPADDLGYRRS